MSIQSSPTNTPNESVDIINNEDLNMIELQNAQEISEKKMRIIIYIPH